MMRIIPQLFICFFSLACGGSRMMQTELYFAQMRPDGTMISDADWKNFKENSIAAVFREGSSTFSVTGNWYDPDRHKLVTEPTYMVSYLYKPSALMSRRIDTLRNLYKARFDQQSVLRIDQKVRASFDFPR